MNIGILSDIHGNHIALKAVLDEAATLGIQDFLVLGDVVGYYYHPKEVLELLKPHRVTMIRGNHEDMLKAAQHNKKEEAAIKAEFGSGVSVALSTLTAEEIAFLAGLPETRRIQLDSISFTLCHGSPMSINERIYPDAPHEMLKKVAASVDSVFLLCGHTHYPLVYAGEKTVLINPGSVGQARDRGGSASWAVVNTANKTVVFRHTSFDIHSLLREAQERDLDVPYLQEVLKR